MSSLFKGTEMAKITLTPRQTQIVELLINRGLSNKHIARELQISESSVKLHVGKILHKFAVKSRLQLVTFLRDKDWAN